jgi:diguanylate cyclase
MKLKFQEFPLDTAQGYAQAALDAMAQHGVTPHPDNFLVWYAYASGQVPELNKEIEQVRHQRVTFTQQVNDYLRDKYLRPSGRNALEMATHDARMLISQVANMVHEYSGEAASYNKRIGEQADRLELHGDEADVGTLLTEIIGQLRQIESSGANFTERLDESRKEIESLRQNLDKMTAESKRDFLTGVLNRRALDEAMIALVDDSVKNNKELTLLMLDIDHFKQFNDKWGHQIGDEVLKTVAKALKHSVRGKDLIARYGGEEFCVILQETPIQGARVVAETIRKTIAGAKLQRKDSKESLGQITVSIGISRYRLQGEEDTIPFFVKRADDALYTAKKNGRNRVVSEV